MIELSDRAIADYGEAIKLDPKQAEAYIERGDQWRFYKHRLDRAIADYTEAIKIEPSLTTYDRRGDAWLDEGDPDRAIADYTEVIRLNTEGRFAYAKRGQAWAAKGDLDRAIADYTEAINYIEAIKFDGIHADYYGDRGRAYFYSGALPEALADLNRESKLRPEDAYAVLWLDIVARRSNLPSRLDDATKQVDMTRWPAPVVRLYLGELTLEAVLAAADHRYAGTKYDQTCEANFFAGELMLQRGAKDEATRMFRLVSADCPKSSVQWWAKAELKALGENS
jgi:tetratricopeptide (TPR) repeat protein